MIQQRIDDLPATALHILHRRPLKNIRLLQLHPQKLLNLLISLLSESNLTQSLQLFLQSTHFLYKHCKVLLLLDDVDLVPLSSMPILEEELDLREDVECPFLQFNDFMYAAISISISFSYYTTLACAVDIVWQYGAQQRARGNLKNLIRLKMMAKHCGVGVALWIQWIMRYRFWSLLMKSLRVRKTPSSNCLSKSGYIIIISERGIEIFEVDSLRVLHKKPKRVTMKPELRPKVGLNQYPSSTQFHLILH